MKTELRKEIEKAVEEIKKKSSLKPVIGIILGTGLGGLAREIEQDAVIPYEEIPGFAVSTVEFHKGRLILGKLSGKNVVAMEGRFHYYEGYSMKEITFPVRVMKELGAKILLISNAAGALNPLFEKGDIMIMKDHINLLGDNPLRGKNDESFGPRFPDMSEPYDGKLIKLVEDIALEEKIKVQKGVYVAMTGPSLETAAEYRFLRIIGADVVGMSTVPENIVAVHMGMKVLGLSVVTDLCFPDNLSPINIKEIIEIANNAEPKLTLLMKKVVEKL
ncbi:purine-nucleoside phosphorylase [candidate division KSB1 bacterium]|nr:MAG: purine-nucleoside phosphorylase [candidate division KSB1 bacterium]